MNKKKFYITAAIPYVNGKPHIGHVLEYVQVDVLRRYHKLLGKDGVSLSGGDENALKNVQAAEKAGRPIQEYIDENTEAFRQLAIKLNAEFDYWQKGSDQSHHFPASQKLWELCARNGDIYKKSYKGLYCVGCEAFYTREELNQDGECFEHPGKKLDEIEEENYFFRLSKYQDVLIQKIESDEFKIVPKFRKNEILSFIRSGLQDISVSRSNERAKNWGVPVPGDPSQRIYVWFDALNIYQSGIGFGWNERLYERLWPADVHAIGKGISRFHTIYWPAFLLSAGLKLPRVIFIHGYLTVNGNKISKSDPTSVIDPIPLIEKYGADAVRYFLLAKISPFDDGDFSEEKLIEVFNADLANNLGNLVARTAKLCEQIPQNYTIKRTKNILVDGAEKGTAFQEYEVKYKTAIEQFLFSDALAAIWSHVDRLNRELDRVKPWEYVKTHDENSEAKVCLLNTVASLKAIAYYLGPFLPETAKKIEEQFSGKIGVAPSLFPRIAK